MRSLLGAVLTIIIIGQPLLGETEISYSGEVRYRSEYDDRSFSRIEDSHQTYDLLRSRVAVEALVDSNTHAFVEFQDSRTLGGKNVFGEFQSGTLNDSKGVDVHQAYVQIDRLWVNGVGFKAGRFEFTMGNERVFGAVGWSNVGRSWEGWQAWYEKEGNRMTLFYLTLQKRQDPLFDRDFDLIGLRLAFKRAGLDVFGTYESDPGATGSCSPYCPLKRYSAGVYWQHHFQEWSAEFNGAFQAGEQYERDDIQAFMATGEIGYTFSGTGEAYIGVGGDYSSGDSNPNDSKLKWYQNLYYTGHKFRGNMDYFVASGTAGLIDLMVRGRGQVLPKWQVMLDGHYFRTAQDYVDPGDSSATSKVGMEVDFTAVTSSVAGVKLQGGVSVFLPQDAFVRARQNNAVIRDSETAVWSYFQATVRF